MTKSFFDLRTRSRILAADSAWLLLAHKVRDEIKFILSKEKLRQLLNPVQPELQHQGCQNLLINQVHVHDIEAQCWPAHPHLHACQLSRTHSVLDISHVMPIHGTMRVPVVLGIEFLKMHARHKLLRCCKASSTHILLWVLVLVVHMMVLGLRVTLRLLIWTSIHHIGLLHLVGVSTTYLAVDLTIHDAIHHVPLPHGCLHGALGPPAVVHELPVRKSPQAGLMSVHRRTIHSHAIPMQASASRAVGHWHHHVFSHAFSTAEI